jgi:hypothetical protein
VPKRQPEKHGAAKRDGGGNAVPCDRYQPRGQRPRTEDVPPPAVPGWGLVLSWKGTSRSTEAPRGASSEAKVYTLALGALPHVYTP